MCGVASTIAHSPLRGCTQSLGKLKINVKAEKPISDTLLGSVEIQVYDYKRKPAADIELPLMFKGEKGRAGTIRLIIATSDPEWEAQKVQPDGLVEWVGQPRVCTYTHPH
jgi:hypothetical protein